MLFIAFLLGVIALYCLIAIMLKLPTFKAAKAFRKTTRVKTNTYKIMLSNGAKKIAKFIPMGTLKQMEMEKFLKAADLNVTPKEYMAEILLSTSIFLVLIVPAYFIHPVLSVLLISSSVILMFYKYKELSRLGKKRKQEIKKELPRFVSYMANTLKSSRNILDIIDTYRADYHTPLTDELALTAADMRTGNAEIALLHMEMRINLPGMSDLVRGLLSAMRGNDMVAYFDNLSNQLRTEWSQNLKMQALKKEPKILGMAFVVFLCAGITIVISLSICFSSASSIFTGLM